MVAPYKITLFVHRLCDVLVSRYAYSKNLWVCICECECILEQMFCSVVRVCAPEMTDLELWDALILCVSSLALDQ